MKSISNVHASSGFNDVPLTLGERIVGLLNQQGRTKLWLANELGISKQALNYLLTRSSGKKYLNEIAELLQVNPAWLETGEGAIFTDPHELLPSIPCIFLSKINELEKNIQQATERVIYVNDAKGQNCFAVVLDNSSMSPHFRKGTILIFNPETKPTDGCYVLAKLKSNREYFFRLYLSDGREAILRAENPDFTDIKINEFEVVGILVQSRNLF